MKKLKARIDALESKLAADFIPIPKRKRKNQQQKRMDQNWNYLLDMHKNEGGGHGFQEYKKEHPGTKKTPSDPMFHPAGLSKKDMDMRNSGHVHKYSDPSGKVEPIYSKEHNPAAHKTLEKTHGVKLKHENLQHKLDQWANKQGATHPDEGNDGPLRPLDTGRPWGPAHEADKVKQVGNHKLHVDGVSGNVSIYHKGKFQDKVHDMDEANKKMHENWFKSLSKEQQEEYLHLHPKSKKR